MVDQKISELVQINIGDLADADEFVIADASASDNKSITWGEMTQSNPTDTTAGRLMRADYGYSPGNILGTVSQSGGTPTGAVIERGSNGNGEYVRFADGTQMCWRTCVVDLSAGSPSFTLPAILASTASARVFLAVDGQFSSWSDSNDRSKAQGNAYSRVESTSSIEIIPSDFTANYGGAEGAFSVLVFGRWF